jgi:hypothetical protein
MNLTRKVMKLKKSMISYYFKPQELSVSTDYQDPIISLELVILLAFFFSFKVEAGVMDSMIKVLFKTVTKEQNIRMESLKLIVPKFGPFQLIFYQNILKMSSETGKKYI